MPNAARLGLPIGTLGPLLDRPPDGVNRALLGRLFLLGTLDFLAGKPEYLGQAPIHHLNLAERPHHDVGRLQVAMDYMLVMGICKSLAYLLEDPQERGRSDDRVFAQGKE